MLLDEAVDEIKPAMVLVQMRERSHQQFTRARVRSTTDNNQLTRPCGRTAAWS